MLVEDEPQAVSGLAPRLVPSVNHKSEIIMVYARLKPKVLEAEDPQISQRECSLKPVLEGQLATPTS